MHVSRLRAFAGSDACEHGSVPVAAPRNADWDDHFIITKDNFGIDCGLSGGRIFCARPFAQ